MGAEPFAGRELKVREIVGGLDEKPYPPRQTLEHWAGTLLGRHGAWRARYLFSTSCKVALSK